MNIKIVCVGKLKEKYWRDAAEEYLKRLRPYCGISVAEVKESRTDDIDEEGKKILAGIRPSEYVISLEIKGKELDSVELAARLDSLALGGRSDVTFVIGGSEGLSEAVRERADFVLSFSRMTFPHQMMRVILLEQIYRSFKINRGEKYHK